MARIKHGTAMHVTGTTAFPFDHVGGDPTSGILQTGVLTLFSADFTSYIQFTPNYIALSDGGAQFFELSGAGNIIRAFSTNGFVLPLHGGDPTGEVGDLFMDDTRGRFRAYEAGAWINLIRGGRARRTSAVAIANTETVVTNFTLHQDFMEVGTTFRIEAYGRLTSGATAGSSIFRCRIGTTTLTGNIPASLTIANAALVTNAPFHLAMLVTIRTDGAGGTAIGNVSVNGGVTGAFTVVADVSATSGTVVVDTTATKLIELTYISGNAGTTATFENATIDLVN
jgi:hypothetical protein